MIYAYTTPEVSTYRRNYIIYTYELRVQLSTLEVSAYRRKYMIYTYELCDCLWTPEVSAYSRKYIIYTYELRVRLSVDTRGVRVYKRLCNVDLRVAGATVCDGCLYPITYPL